MLVATLSLAAALVALVPAARTGTAPNGFFEVSPFTVGDRSAEITLQVFEPIAHVQLSIPAGYSVALGQPAGTVVGHMSATLVDARESSAIARVDAELVVDETAKYETDPAAQACARGAHAATWLAEVSVLGQTFGLPIFVDLGGATDSGPSAATLRFCPTWVSSRLPKGVTEQLLHLTVENVVSAPTSPGRYTWSALVTPRVGGTIAPDPSRVFELRSFIPYPHTLTLQARHDPKAKSVALTGRLTAAGEPEQGADIDLLAVNRDREDVIPIGRTQTNEAGEFTITRRIVRTTRFIALAFQGIRPCSTPSSAPAGCALETVPSTPGATASVKVRRATDPKLVTRARDQRLARRINLKLSDFRQRWQAFDNALSVLACARFTPGLSDLTATGEVESPLLFNDDTEIVSRTSIYASERDARMAFGREARLAYASCLAEERRGIFDPVRLRRAVPVPALGSEIRAFRVVTLTFTLDLVSFRQRRAVVHMAFFSEGRSFRTKRQLAAKVAARARGA